MKVIEKTNIIWALIVTALSAVFGKYWYLFAAFMVLNMLDYITGIIKAKRFNEENSEKGLNGIVKKLGYWVVVAIAFFLAKGFVDLGEYINHDLGFTVFFGWFVLVTFIINEIRSILENLVVMGVEVPSWLTKGLKIAADKINSAAGGDKFKIVKMRVWKSAADGMCPITATDNDGNIVWFNNSLGGTSGTANITNYEFTVPYGKNIARIYFSVQSAALPSANYFDVQKYYEYEIASKKDLEDYAQLSDVESLREQINGMESVDADSMENLYLSGTIQKIEDWTLGAYITTNEATATLDAIENDVYAHTVIKCDAGDVFIISGRGGSAPRLWAFLDEGAADEESGSMKYNVLSSSDITVGAEKLILEAPDNSKYLVLNMTQSYGYSAYKLNDALGMAKLLSKTNVGGEWKTVTSADMIGKAYGYVGKNPAVNNSISFKDTNNTSYIHYYVHAHGGDRFKVVFMRSYSSICPIVCTDSDGNVKWIDRDGASSVSNYGFTVPYGKNISRVYFSARSSSAPNTSYFNVQRYREYEIASKNDIADTEAVNALKTRIDGLESSEAFSGEMKPYLKDEYNDTLGKLQALSGVSTASFVFFSDLHYSSDGSGYSENDLRTPVFNMIAAVRKLSREFPLACVVAGGDYMQMPTIAAGMTKQMGIDNIMDINRALSGIDAPHIAIAGNHEAGYRSGGSSGVSAGSDCGLTASEIYGLLGRKYVTGEIKQASSYVFYQIDDADGICWIYMSDTVEPKAYLQTGIDTALAENIGNYPVVAIHHFGINHGTSGSAAYTDPTVYNGTQTMINYIKNKGFDMIAWVCGHCHSDWVRVYNGVPVISCLQSGYWSPAPSEGGVTYDHNNKLGTADESSFSVFTIDKSKGKLYCTRFGLGVDREINYNTISGEIGLVAESEAV